MKKLLIVAALFVASFANAQKGTVLVGGSINFSSTKKDQVSGDSKMNSFGLNPKVGYQFNDNWTVGGEFNVVTSKNESVSFNGFTNSKNENKINGFSAGAFVRYTRPLSETFSVFADLGAGFQSEKGTQTANDGFVTTRSTNKGDGMYVGVTPALFINFKKSFGLNFSIGGLGYQTLNYDNNGGDNSNFYFNFGQTVNIGISKNF